MAARSGADTYQNRSTIPRSAGDLGGRPAVSVSLTLGTFPLPLDRSRVPPAASGLRGERASATGAQAVSDCL